MTKYRAYQKMNHLGLVSKRAAFKYALSTHLESFTAFPASHWLVNRLIEASGVTKRYSS